MAGSSHPAPSAPASAFVVALALIAAPPAVTLAQEGQDPRREAARQALVEAEAHMDAGRYALAARGFEDVYRRMVEIGMERAPLMHWNLGLALLEIPGRERAALDAFRRFLAESAQLSNDEMVTRFRAMATQHVAELEARQEVGVTPSSSGSGGNVVLTALGIGALVLGAAGGGMAVGFLMERNRNAELWNDAERCLEVDPQRTRGENCGPFADAAQSNETAAIATTVAGGVLMAAGTVLLVLGLTASGGESGASSVACGPAGLGLACAGRF